MMSIGRDEINDEEESGKKKNRRRNIDYRNIKRNVRRMGRRK